MILRIVVNLHSDGILYFIHYTYYTYILNLSVERQAVGHSLKGFMTPPGTPADLATGMLTSYSMQLLLNKSENLLPKKYLMLFDTFLYF